MSKRFGFWPHITHVIVLTFKEIKHLSDYRTVGLSDRRTIGLSDYRTVGLSDCRIIGRTPFLCSKNLHFTHRVSWYSSVNKLLKIFNIQDNSMCYNKSKFGFILRKCLNQKYLSDWKDTSESLKDGKLTTYLFLKTNFKLEKYLTL